MTVDADRRGRTDSSEDAAAATALDPDRVRFSDVSYTARG
jgi:hypothetical protein